MNYRSFGILTLLAFGMDQLTKLQARSLLHAGDVVELVAERMWAVLAFNQYGAMSMGEGVVAAPVMRFLLVVAGFAGLAVLLAWLHRAEFQSATGRSGLALMCGGALGNLRDQFFDARGVTDFLAIGHGVPQGGIFNLADVWVVAGGVLVFGTLVAFKWRQYRAGPSSSPLRTV